MKVKDGARTRNNSAAIANSFPTHPLQHGTIKSHIHEQVVWPSSREYHILYIKIRFFQSIILIIDNHSHLHSTLSYWISSNCFSLDFSTIMIVIICGESLAQEAVNVATIIIMLYMC